MSGMLLSSMVHRLEVTVLFGASPFRCLTLSCASFSFVFDLSACMSNGPQAPSTMLLATSQNNPVKTQQSTGLDRMNNTF